MQIIEKINARRIISLDVVQLQIMRDALSHVYEMQRLIFEDELSSGKSLTMLEVEIAELQQMEEMINAIPVNVRDE